MLTMPQSTRCASFECCSVTMCRAGRRRSARRWVVPIAAVWTLSSIPFARAQDHHHPPQDAELHEKFYSTWMMPDNPNRSCCNRHDCYPTEVRYRDGHWEARRREDGRFIRVPREKIEQRRDNPDGRSHVCMPPPNLGYRDDEVFCFTLGGGT